MIWPEMKIVTTSKLVVTPTKTLFRSKSTLSPDKRTRE